MFEIQNQKECYELLLEKIVKNEKINEELVILVHKTLTNGTYDEVRYSKGERPGKYKIGDYIVGKEETDSKAENVHNDIVDLKPFILLRMATEELEEH